MLERAPLQSSSSLAGLLKAVGGPSSGVKVLERDGLALVAVQARKGKRASLAARVESLFGLALPTGPRRAAAGGVTFLGAAPGRWLAIDETGSAAFADFLAESLDGLASITEQTGGISVLRVSGPRARATFAKGLPIDLDPSSFAVGDVATTAIAHVGVTIWQVDEVPTYDIAVIRSLAGGFWHWLSHSAGEFGLAVGD